MVRAPLVGVQISSVEMSQERAVEQLPLRVASSPALYRRLTLPVFSDWLLSSGAVPPSKLLRNSRKRGGSVCGGHGFPAS